MPSKYKPDDIVMYCVWPGMPIMCRIDAVKSSSKSGRIMFRYDLRPLTEPKSRIINVQEALLREVEKH